MILDTYKHKGLRKKLVGEIRSKGIENEEVLSVMEEIPRHLFMDNAFLSFAYEDKAFPIGSGQTISQPFTVAFQSELLNLRKRDKVLEIGTGSGYQTAVLVKLGAKVVTIERHRPLFNQAKLLLEQLGMYPKFLYGDGYLGAPPFAPFDKIIVTAGAPLIPEALKSQLNIGGRLVIPVGEGDTQTMYAIDRINETEFDQQEFGKFKFVPLLENKA